MNGAGMLVVRQQLAVQSFIEALNEQFGFGAEDATTIWRVYLKEKVVKANPHTGQFDLRHGIFWDREIMERALEVAEEEGI